MLKFLKSKTALAVGGLMVAAFMLLSVASPASAMTQAEANAVISALNLTGTQAAAIQALVTTGSTTTTTTTTTTYDLGTSTLRVGSRGQYVKNLQMFLSITADGDFGPHTKAAVMAWQKSNSLTADGIVGPNTKGAMKSHMTSTGSTSTTTTTGLPQGCTSTSGYSPMTGASCATGATNNQTGPITAMISTDNPASGTIIAGQAQADLAHITFTGNGVINSLTLTRGGVSDASTLSNVYLYNGATRLTDGYTFNNAGVLTMNNVNLAVNGSTTVSVKANVSSATTSYSINVTLSSFTSGTSVNNANIKGNDMYLATGTNVLGTANLTVTAPYPTASSINAGSTNQSLWSNTVSIGVHNSSLYGMTVKMIGSAPSNTLANVSLFVDGTKVGSASINANNQFVFDLSGSPATLNTGSHTIEVRGDVVGGANRNFYLSLENAADLMIKDTQVSGGVYLTPTYLTGTLNNILGGVITVNNGTLTINQDPAFSNVTSLVGGSTAAKLAAFKFTSYGEDVKVNSLVVTPTITSTGTTATATAAVSAGAVSSFTVTAGGTGYVTAPAVTITANNSTATATTTGITPVVAMATGGSGYVVAPTVTISGGTCSVTGTATATISGGAVTAITASGWTCSVAPTTVVITAPTGPTLATATATISGGVVTGITVASGGAGYATAPTISIAAPSATTLTLANVGLYVNGGQVGSNQTATSGTNMTFSNLGSNLIATAGSPVTVEIRGDVMTSGNVNVTAATVQFSLVAGASNAQGVTSGQLTSTPSASGQTLTVGSSNVTFAQTAGMAASTVAPNQAGVKIGSFTLSSGSSEGVTINNILVALAGNMITNNHITNITIKDGSTLVGSPIGNPTTSNNFSVSLPVNASSTKTLDVYGDIASGATGETVTPTMTITYRGNTSNVTTTSAAVGGSVITANVPSIATTGITFVSSASPVAQFLIGGQSSVAIGTFNVVSSAPGIAGAVIKDVTVTVPVNTIGSVTMNGVTASVVGTTATLYNVGVTVPADASGVNIPMSVSLVCVNASGGCAGISNSTVTASITNMTYNNGVTVTSVIPASAITPSSALVATKPTVSMTGSSGSGLVNGNIQVGTFTVSADPAGDLKLVNIPITLSISGAATVSNITLRDSTGNTQITGTNTLSASGTFIFSSPRTIAKGTSETYTVWATFAGVTGGSNTMNETFGLGSSSSFTWSDVIGAVTPITGGLLNTYPTATQTKSN